MPTAAGETVLAERLRLLLRRRATSVTVVTAAGDSGPVGFTATSFTSVSLSPPMISFCVGRRSSSWPSLSETEHVAVHVLEAAQADLARTFATRGIDRFDGTDWRPGPYGVPLLQRTLAWLVCRVAARVPAGDHVIVIGEPMELDCVEGSPLMYHNGRYRALS